MNTLLKPSIIQFATLLRSMGSALEIPEITSIGNEVLDLSVMTDDAALARMASETLLNITHFKVAGKAPLPFRNNYDYGELWPKVLDDYRDGKIRTIVDFVRKKRKAEKRKKSSYVAPIDSYCGSKRNVKYWSELLKSSPSQSVVDFIKYIQEVACGAGEST